MPVVPDPRDFDRRSGNRLERLIFNHRPLILALCAIVTVFLGYEATQLKQNASFEKMLPVSHPYIQNYLENRKILGGLGNTVRIVVENTQGTIFDKDALLVAQKVTDTLLVMPGVDRSWVRGLWTPSLRWTEVTEEGYRGGPVMPDDWDGSPQSTEQLGINIARSGIVGSYVAGNFRSTLIVVPLLDVDQDTGKPLDYAEFSRALETRIRALQSDKIKIHIVGFAKIVGDLIEGLDKIAMFFFASTLIAGICVFFYTRCIRSTLLLVGAALLGVVWLLGLLRVFGYVLDPYSILVPFLIFAIGLSHGAQKMNGIMQDIGRGTHRYVAARYTFRRLFLAGLTALGTNILGFAALAVIDIPVIRDLAVTTSMGIAILIFTKLVLVPIALSYVGVSQKAAQHSLQAKRGQAGDGFWLPFMVRFTERRMALAAISVTAVLAVVGFAISTQLQFGDLDAGAPELRPDSRYNRDNAFVNSNYGRSSDQFVVMLKTPPGGCAEYETLIEADRLAEQLRDVDGVLAVVSAADVVRLIQSGVYEGNPKWTTISPNPSNRQAGIESLQADRPELGERSCTLTPIVAYLKDHRAATLARVVKSSEDFAKAHDVPGREFQLAAGNAGIEAATNIVVRRANGKLLFILYASVILLCFLVFRSWRAVLVALVPLTVSSILCEALMVTMGIGVKVATLPVIAVGVGVGVDYALYLLSVQLARQRAGDSLPLAYLRALKFTGKVVALIGFTMAIGVVTWAWSPIKFQADMGILLTFMFLWNMLGALFLIPALSHFLLRSPDSDNVGAVDDAPATAAVAAPERRSALKAGSR
ncbi:MMPL family transporter [Hydrocarboniphaga sp.]|uniref:efflux RND transporter permease subunit n=1 Tax=Hydrocarboniphaga sp. TaxID=2033016 RepID=UPI00345263E4